LIDSFPILNLQVSENRDFVQRKREVVSFSPNDMSSVESFLEVGFSPPLL
jgi:hypothetical protein